MNNETVCAVVVTYNRKELLIECLEALENQSRPVDAIYIVDNASTDGTPELLLEKKYLEELPVNEIKENFEETIQKDNITIHYHKMSENTGGAGGFHEGVKRAYEYSYDWVWLMDDDAEPLKDSLEKLSKYFDEDNVSALTGVVKTGKNQITSRHRGFFDFNKFSNWLIIDKVKSDLINNNEVLEVDFASFVGILVNRKSISEVGFPKKEFFIYGDDFEYCIRLREFGRILLIRDSVIEHKAQSSSKSLRKKIFGHKFVRMYYENYWINYYSLRNTVWILKRNRQFIYFWIMLLISWLFSLFLIIILDDHKLRRMKFLSLAYIDGLNSNFDNKKPKDILYK